MRRTNRNKKPRNRRKQQIAVRNSPRSNIYIERFGPINTGRLNYLAPWCESPMRYMQTYAVTIIPGGVSDLKFRANSLFSPEYVGGHQPLGYDQMVLNYNRYVVDKLDWMVSFGACNQQIPCGAGIINGAQTYTNLSTFQAFSESPQTRILTLPTNLGGPSTIFVGHKQLPPFIGVSHKYYLTDDRFQSFTSTNPVETIDFHVVAYNPTIVNVTVVFTVSLKMRAIFFDPVIPLISLNDKEEPPAWGGNYDYDQGQWVTDRPRKQK